MIVMFPTIITIKTMKLTRILLTIIARKILVIIMTKDTIATIIIMTDIILTIVIICGVIILPMDFLLALTTIHSGTTITAGEVIIICRPGIGTETIRIGGDIIITIRTTITIIRMGIIPDISIEQIQ